MLVAGVSAFYARQSATAERQSATADAGSLEIERARRLQEWRPHLSGIIEFDLMTGKYMLQVSLDSDEPLAGLDIRIPAGQSVAFRQDDPNSGVVPAEPGEVALRASAPSISGGSPVIPPRHWVRWPVDLQRTDLPPVRLEATCHGELRGPAFSGLTNLRLYYAVAFISRYSSMASCGVRYPSAE
jgi:hypothetical protein